MERELRVLVLEDSEKDYALVRRELSSAGIAHDARRVVTREAFTATLADFHADIILADYSLPAFDGLSALGIAREMCPNVPFLFVSGSIGEDRAIEALRSGATDYVLKDRLSRLGPVVKRVLRELEERRQRRLAVEQSLQMVEASPNAMIMVDRKGRITLVNAQAEKLFGYPRKELIELTIEALVPERFRGKHGGHREGFFGDPRTRPMGAGRDLYGLRKDGSEVPIEIGLNPIATPEGSFVLASIIDITERKRAEAEIARYVEDLRAQRLAALNLAQDAEEARRRTEASERRLAASIEDLARSNKELEQFAYVASHDLQEPLRMVGSFVQLIERKYKGALDEQADRYIHFAVDGARRMQGLIKDLLKYSRVARGELMREPVDCGQLLDGVRSNLRVALEESGARLVVGPLPSVPAIPSLLAQVFQNLIDNAIKYRREGVPPEIHVSAEARDGRWVFSVKDNGLGIEPQHLDRIFVIFQRLHGREKYPGSGIGLAITKKIVERHGGRIWVESVPGESSTFYFSLAPDADVH